jgi:hypothetical protein
MIDYTELYCTTDVGILAEVVTQFRKTVLHNFNLDPCHYISTPQMSYDAMLRMTKVELQLLHDIDMVSRNLNFTQLETFSYKNFKHLNFQILFVEQNVRGGVSYINTRHCEKKETSESKTEMLFIDGKSKLFYLNEGLNLGPFGYQPKALPTELFRCD